MNRRKRVYICGPISKGDLLHNVNQATAAFIALAQAGFSPFCPMWSVYSKPAVGSTYSDEMTYADWIGVDLPWVEVSDAVLRLPGESTDADPEVALAAAYDIPTLYSVEDIIKWFGPNGGGNE